MTLVSGLTTNIELPELFDILEINDKITYVEYSKMIDGEKKIFNKGEPINCLRAFKINNYSGIFLLTSILLN